MTDAYLPYLAIGAGLFALGAIGFLTRRNMILMVLSSELMLHGVSLTFVTFSRMHGTHEGQAFTIFLLTVTACEAGLGMALFLALYQLTKSLDVNLWSDLREPDLPPPVQPAPLPPPVELPPDPRLTPAGVQPNIKELELAGSR